MKPELAVTNVVHREDKRVIELDTYHTTYQGRTWTSLSGHQKRKCETLLLLSYPTEPVHIIYH